MRKPGSEIVIATGNAGKVKEFEPLFREKGMTVKSLRDFPSMPPIVEDGATFADNALIKARAVALQFGIPALADDSGLCVDRLGGAPGVFSARYAGEGATDADNNRKLLSELTKQAAASGGPAPEMWPAAAPRPLSPARFVCAIAVVDAEGNLIAQSEGSCEGWIIDAPRGERGFGYDPLFYLPRLDKTLAELSLEEKNAISHRGRAIEKLWAGWT